MNSARFEHENFEDAVEKVYNHLSGFTDVLVAHIIVSDLVLYGNTAFTRKDGKRIRVHCEDGQWVSDLTDN